MAGRRPPRPMCFVAMPFGKKAPPGRRKPLIDFNAVYAVLEKAAKAEKLDCIRADFEPGGGFIHRAMFERLVVAEYVIADVTFANPNVTYELGLRHGASVGRTLLVCEQNAMRNLPFDLGPLRAIPYTLGATGRPTPTGARDLDRAVRDGFRDARKTRIPDNPIVQITQLRPSVAGHEKTDVFMERMRYVSEIGRRVDEALRTGDRARAALEAIQVELTHGSEQVAQLHTALLSLYLGYRAVGAYDRMVALWDEMGPELQETPVAREQLAFALNRQAEQRAKQGDHDGAGTLRGHAVAALEALDRARWTSETFAILGRIHKGQSDAEARADRPDAAADALTRAIGAYEDGFRADPRDYFPGINAVTLRLLRHHDGDEEAVAALVPVVRFAVARAPAPRNDDERYWQTATRLELDTAGRDWAAARTTLETLRGIPVASWMRQTTADNLERQARAREGERETVGRLRTLIAALGGSASGPPLAAS